MTLTYRGKTYTPCYISINAPQHPIFGIYRGITYNTCPDQTVIKSH